MLDTGTTDFSHDDTKKPKRTKNINKKLNNSREIEKVQRSKRRQDVRCHVDAALMRLRVLCLSSIVSLCGVCVHGGIQLPFASRQNKMARLLVWFSRAYV